MHVRYNELNFFQPMSTRRLVILLTFLAIFAMAARISIDNDTWWHMRIGQWMITSHFHTNGYFLYTPRRSMELPGLAG